MRFASFWLLVMGATLPAFALEEGTYALEGENGVKGTAWVERHGLELVVSTHLEGASQRPRAREDVKAPGTFVYAKRLAMGGIASSVDEQVAHDAAIDTWTLTLKPGQGALVAEIREGQRLHATERLVKKTPPAPPAGWKAALILPANSHGSDKNAFKSYASTLAARYRLFGFKRADILQADGMESAIAALREAAHEGRPYTRVVFIGHGGWDGPIRYGNASQTSWTSNKPVFYELIGAVKVGTTPDAKLFSSSCHAGGNNKNESISDYRWTDDLARRSGRIVSGPNGPTSTEYTFQHVLALLEGQGVTKQEVQWSSPEGFRTIPPGGSLNGAIRPWAKPLPEPTAIKAEMYVPRKPDPATVMAAGWHH